MKGNIMIGLLLLGILVFGLYSYGWALDNDEKEIRVWVTKRGEMTMKVELRTWSTGPFYITKNYRIFKVNTDKNVYWFRYGWLSPDIYQEVGTDYKEIK